MFDFYFILLSTSDKVQKKKRTKWSKEENELLRLKFKTYLQGQGSVHAEDLRKIQEKLNGRTLPQIRVKLNNMKMGKCT